MSLDLDSIFAKDPLDYWVEIWSDDDKTYETISKHRRFALALEAYTKLVAEQPNVRVVMRHRAHVYRNHFPARLHNSYDRSKEYPME